jgi:hypothetical protein
MWQNIYSEFAKRKHKKASGLLHITDEKPNGRRHCNDTSKP